MRATRIRAGSRFVVFGGTGACDFICIARGLSLHSPADQFVSRPAHRVTLSGTSPDETPGCGLNCLGVPETRLSVLA